MNTSLKPDVATVLVTGATGYTGRAVARAFWEQGAMVHAVVRVDSDTTALVRTIPGAAIHRLDPLGGGLREIIGRVRPKLVAHLAARVLVDHRADDIADLCRANIEFLAHLVDAMAAVGTGALINTGSPWQHFAGRPWVPANLYAATKTAAEAILAYYTDATPLRALTLALPDTYGPADPRPKLLPLLARARRDGMTLDLTPGEQVVDPVYIDDIAAAYLVASDLVTGDDDARSRYAVTSGTPITVRELVEHYCSIAVPPPCTRLGGRPYRSREVLVPERDTPILSGWAPTIDLDTGLRLVVAAEGRIGER